MAADRFNEGKVQLSYLLDAPLAMEGLCRRFELGAKKYERDNWKKGLDDNELIDSLLRHLKKVKEGEYYDPKDGGTHLDAIMWNAYILAQQGHTRHNEAMRADPTTFIIDTTPKPIHRPGDIFWRFE